MPVILWAVVALGLAFIAVLVAARHTRSLMPPLVLPPGETLPTVPLQRVVRWSLAAGVPLSAAAAALVTWSGPTTYMDDDAIRLTVTGLWLAALVVLALPTMLAGVWSSRADGPLDERDRAILARAPAGQAAAMLIVLVIWVLALTEGYRGAPGIPDVFLTLIFWSCLLVSQAAANVGILVGYRRT